MTITQWLNKTYMILKDEESFSSRTFMIRPHLVCNDGFIFSVQASGAHYCRPRSLLSTGLYKTVEVMYPTIDVPYYQTMDDYKLLMEEGDWEGPCDGLGEVFGNVPVNVVDDIINMHGGINDNFV